MVLAGLLAFVMACILFADTDDMYSYHYSHSYGGDAYTYMQRDTAEIANQTHSVRWSVDIGLGSLLMTLGVFMIGAAIALAKSENKRDYSVECISVNDMAKHMATIDQKLSLIQQQNEKEYDERKKKEYDEIKEKQDKQKEANEKYWDEHVELKNSLIKKKKEILSIINKLEEKNKDLYSDIESVKSNAFEYNKAEQIELLNAEILKNKSLIAEQNFTIKKIDLELTKNR